MRQRTCTGWPLLCRSLSNPLTSTSQLPACMSVSVYLSVSTPCLPGDWCLAVPMHSCLPCDFGCWHWGSLVVACKHKNSFVMGHFNTISYIPCSIAASTLKYSSVTVFKLYIARKISTIWLTLPPFNSVTLSNIFQDLVCVTRLKPHSNVLLCSKGYYCMWCQPCYMSACTGNLFLTQTILLKRPYLAFDFRNASREDSCMLSWMM